MRLVRTSLSKDAAGKESRLRAARTIVGLILLALFAAGGFIRTGYALPETTRPFDSLDSATRVLATRLLEQARANLGRLNEGARRLVVVDLFTDGATGEVSLAGNRIGRAVVGAARQRFREFNVVGLTSKTGVKADYWIGGTLTRTTSGRNETPSYRIQGTLKDVWSGSEIGRAEVAIAATSLNTTPMAIYTESPFYDFTVFKTRNAGDQATRQASAVYAGYPLEIRALLMDAARAYEQRDFNVARTLLEQAAKSPDGHTLFTFSGLYLVNRQLGRPAEAARAMRRAIAISIEKHGRLMIRLVFEKGSAEFPATPSIKDTYIEWLEHIGAYFLRSDECLQIIGHASRTGPDKWNALLSRRRAKLVQKQLRATLPDTRTRSEAVGVGSRENLVGIGTDDKRDALDRRVEIAIIDCKRLPAR